MYTITVQGFFMDASTSFSVVIRRRFYSVANKVPMTLTAGVHEIDVEPSGGNESLPQLPNASAALPSVLNVGLALS
jgi:hypothetical protein